MSCMSFEEFLMVYDIMTLPYAKPFIKKKELREVEKMYGGYRDYVNEHINETPQWLETEGYPSAITFIQDCIIF